MLLIFGFPEDVHSIAVKWSLDGAGVSTSLFDASHFPSDGTITIELMGNSDGVQWTSVDGSTCEVSFSEITAVWARRMNARLINVGGVHPEDQFAVRNECRSFLRGLWQAIPQNATWINQLAAQEMAMSKARQLQMAARSGFKVMPTIMTNDPEKVREFYFKNDGEIICKPFYQETWSEGGACYVQLASMLKEEHLAKEVGIRLSPAIYQRYCEKSFELRVLVAGDDVIAARIDSQEFEVSRIDWRADRKHLTKVSRYELSVVLKEKILLFMRSMGLVFGSLDLIVSPNGDVVFLEVNEQGQFLWLEDRCQEITALATVSRFMAKCAGFVGEHRWPNLKDFRISEEYNSICNERVADGFRNRLDITSRALRSAV